MLDEKALTSIEEEKRRGEREVIMDNAELARVELARKTIIKLTGNPQAADLLVTELAKTNWQSRFEENTDDGDLSDIIGEVNKLKRKVGKIAELEQRVFELEKQSGKRTEKQPPGSLPPGTVLALDFFRKHDVSASRYRYQIEKGYDGDLLKTTAIPHPTRLGGVKERYLTIEQQQQTLDYWHKYGVPFTALEEEEEEND